MNRKFVQTLDSDVYGTLNIVAKETGITVQELLRAVVIPEWMRVVSGQYLRKERSEEILRNLSELRP